MFGCIFNIMSVKVKVKVTLTIKYENCPKLYVNTEFVLRCKHTASLL
jgi:hypothetical protein